MHKIFEEVALNINRHDMDAKPVIEKSEPSSHNVERNTNASSTPHVNHFDLVRVIERMYRRYLDRLRIDLIRIGAEDISPAHAMLLFTIGDDELSVRDLMDRGHYLGSNASYSLKQLVQSGYVDRTASARDKRSARIRLTEKGKNLCNAIKVADEVNQDHVVQSEKDLQALGDTFAMLRKLEIIWATDLQQTSPRLDVPRP
jgi:DNA-binding MarR family transcriptional regulator